MDALPREGWSNPASLSSRRLALAVALIAALLGLALVGAPLPALGALLALAAGALVLRSPYLGLLGYIAIEYIRPGEMSATLGGLHLQRIAALGLLGAVCLVQVTRTLRAREGRAENPPPPLISTNAQSLALFALLGVMFASVLTAHWKSWSLLSALDFAKTVVAYLLILHLVRSERQARGLLWLFALIVGWHAAWAGWGYLTGQSVTYAQGIYRAVSFNTLLGEPNALASLMASALPVLVYLALAERSRPLKLIAIALAPIVVGGIVFTGSRTGVLSVLGVAVYLALHSRRKALAIGAIALMVAMTFAALPQDRRERILSIGNYNEDGSAVGRFRAWQAALQMFADRPLLGVGPGGFMAAHGDVYSSRSHPSYLDAHNLFFQIIAEIGLLGLIAFGTFVALVIRNQVVARRLLRQRGLSGGHAYAMLLALGGSLVSLLITGVAGHTLFRFGYYFVGGLTLVYLRGAKATPAPESPSGDLQPGPLSVSGRA